MDINDKCTTNAETEESLISLPLLEIMHPTSDKNEINSTRVNSTPDKEFINNCAKQIEQLVQTKNIEKVEKPQIMKVFSCIHAAGIEDFMNYNSDIELKDETEEASIGVSVGNDNSLQDFDDQFEGFDAEDETCKLYLGPFTMRHNLKELDFVTGELTAFDDFNSISNGLIIEMYHYWMKKKYKTSYLTDWIRSLCPHPIRLTDPSLYVKVKNLIGAKHKQLIKSKTKKFKGCLRKFQEDTFFRSENLSFEDLTDETQKEKELRMALEKANKVINRQNKQMNRNNAVIKSLSYDLTKMTKELEESKSREKSLRKLTRSLSLHREDFVSNALKEEAASHLQQSFEAEVELGNLGEIAARPLQPLKRIKPNLKEQFEVENIEIKIDPLLAVLDSFVAS